MLKAFSKRGTVLPVFSAALLAFAACSNSQKKSADSDSVVADTVATAVALVDSANPDEEGAGEEAVVEGFHANSDIGMLASSIVDAIKVGEKLDPGIYTGRVVLTDGQGRPLYQDVKRMPGEWDVKVISNNSASIANVNDGDLAADELVGYITSCLQLDDTPPASHKTNRKGVETTVYRLNKGKITFVQTPAKKGSMLSVTISG